MATCLCSVIPFFIAHSPTSGNEGLHYGKMVNILAHSMPVRPLYHSDTLAKIRLAESKCFLSERQARLPVTDKKEREGYIDIEIFAEKKSIQRRLCEVRMFYPYQHHPSVTCFFSLRSAALSAFSHRCS